MLSPCLLIGRSDCQVVSSFIQEGSTSLCYDQISLLVSLAWFIHLSSQPFMAWLTPPCPGGESDCHTTLVAFSTDGADGLSKWHPANRQTVWCIISLPLLVTIKLSNPAICQLYLILIWSKAESFNRAGIVSCQLAVVYQHCYTDRLYQVASLNLPD